MPHRTTRPLVNADDVRTYLELSRLLDDLERTRPDLSAPLRLTLHRSHREGAVAWLDEARFRQVVADLVRDEPGAA